LDKVLALNPVSFYWKNENIDKEKHFGFIAQEIEEVLPELIRQDSQGKKLLNYNEFIPFLVQALKEQQKEIEELKLALNEYGILATSSEQQTSNLEHPTILDQFTLAIKKSLENLSLILENGIAKVEKLLTKEIETEKITTEKICSKSGKCVEVSDELIEKLNDLMTNDSTTNDLQQTTNNGTTNNGTTSNGTTNNGTTNNGTTNNQTTNNQTTNNAATSSEQQTTSNEATSSEQSTCTPNWQCQEWQPSAETISCGQTFTQTRTCNDGCGNEKTEEQELKGIYCEQGTCILEKSECE
jgi:flagellar biosynthesis chaperone FliJ